MNNIDIVNRFYLNGGILSINQSQTSLIIITQNYQVFEIDMKNMQMRNLATMLHSKELPHKYSKIASANKNLISITESSSKILSIRKIKSPNEIFINLDYHKGSISASNFSKNNNMLASGGEDGRVHIYNTNKLQKMVTLPYKPDYISALNFSKDSRFLFASCFNKSNIVFDCQRTKTTNMFNTNEVVEWADFFDNNSKLFMILRNANSIVYDTRANETISIATPFTSWPSIFYISEDDNLAIVGSRDSTIYAINLKENRKIFSIKLENTTGISALYMCLGKIFIGFTNGELLVINYNDKNDEFTQACKNKDYKSAAKLLDRNIFLSILPCASIFDDDWEIILKDATKLLSQDKIDDAIELVEPFMRDDAKKQAFNIYLNSKNTIQKFQDLINKKLYEEAYNMTLQSKFLLKTSHFDNLENIWHKTFSNAKRILEEDVGYIDSAKKILEPFIKTPKKPVIMQLLNNLNIFKDAEQMVKDQNFKDYFLLTSNFSYLKDTELYKKVLLLGDNLYQKAIDCENGKKYDEFMKLAKFLQNFPSYKDVITSHLVSVSKKIEIINLIKDKKTDEIYKLALEFDELQYLDEFKEFSKEFNNLYNQAREIAFNGKAYMLENIFKDYIKIEYWLDSIKNIYKIAYIEEFKFKIRANNAINWEKSINNYIDIFGKDDEIIDFCTVNKLDYILDKTNNKERVKISFRYQKTLIQQ